MIKHLTLTERRKFVSTFKEVLLWNNWRDFFKYLFQIELNSIVELFIKFLEIVGILKTFSKLYKKTLNPNLICYGSMMGKKFIDNPKYLYLYIRQRQKEKGDCYDNIKYLNLWFTSSKNTYVEMKQKGFNVVYNYSFEAISILRSAKYIITAWTLISDFLSINYNPKSIIVQTWHGHQFKKIGADTSKSYHNYSKQSKFFYIISPSKNINKFLKSGFLVKDDQILLTGLPRNDVLIQSNSKLRKILLKKYKIPNRIKQIILYAPTYRENDLTAKFPISDKNIEELNTYLAENEILLLCKSHIANKIDMFKPSKNIRIMNKYSQTQELIVISDLLITDYSTLYFDFILMDKPAILFPYDYKDYIVYPGLYHNLDDIKIFPIAYTGDQLINLLKSKCYMDETSILRIKEVKEKYWEFSDGNSCERFFSEMFKIKIMK